MKSKLNNKRLLAYIASVIVALLVLFGCQGCTRQIVKPEVKPEVSTPKQNTAKQYYNFKTVSQAETPLAIIAVIPENWPFDEENSLTYGVLNTELIQRGFHVVSLNNLYDLVETKYIQLGFYKNLNYKQMKEKLKIDAILVYQSSGTNIDKASFRLVDASTSEILLSSSFIVGDEVLDELCYKAIVSEIEKVYKSKHESYRNDFVKTENELVSRQLSKVG